MKGTIVSAWIETCRNLYGDSITDEALKYYNISPNRIFTPTEDIEDKLARGIVERIGNKVGRTSDQVWTMLQLILGFILDSLNTRIFIPF